MTLHGRSSVNVQSKWNTNVAGAAAAQFSLEYSNVVTSCAFIQIFLLFDARKE